MEGPAADALFEHRLSRRRAGSPTALARAVLCQWEGAGYLAVAVGLLVGFWLALGWNVPSLLVPTLALLLMPSALSWSAMDTGRYRIAALSGLVGAAFSLGLAGLLLLAATGTWDGAPMAPLAVAEAVLQSAILAAPFVASACCAANGSRLLWQARQPRRLGPADRPLRIPGGEDLTPTM